MARCCEHGQVPQRRRNCCDDQLGVSAIEPDRVRSRYNRLRRGQQCRLGLDCYVQDVSSRRNILRRDHRGTDVELRLLWQLVSILSLSLCTKLLLRYDRFVVSSSGSFTGTVPARGAIAMYVGQTITPTSVQVTFAPTVSTVYGENVFVVGSISQLGNWTASASVSVLFIRLYSVRF
jgi:hypothetical protein